MKTNPNSPDGGCLLMVGRRRGAIVAAKRRGWEPIVLDVPPRGEQARDAFGGSSGKAVDMAKNLLAGRSPVNVVAVATGAVVAASNIRAEYGLPGITPEVALRCHDKLVMKRAVSAAGIPCADWCETNEQTTAEELIDQLGLPVILKLPISSGGRGVWVCRSADEVRRALRPGLLAEAFQKGTEMSVETFLAEGNALFRNPTRYFQPRRASIVPADLGDEDKKQVDDLAARVHQALNIDSGITHMEVFLNEEGPVFGEIAARPPGGYLMDLMRIAYGFDPWDALLGLAVGDVVSFPASASAVAGVWLIHPGAGIVRDIQGLEQVAALEGVMDISCKLKRGDVVTQRFGSGDARGRIFTQAPTHQECADVLARTALHVDITMDSWPEAYLQDESGASRQNSGPEGSLIGNVNP